MLMVSPLSPAPTVTLAPALSFWMTFTHPGSTLPVPELGVQTIIGNKGTEIPGIPDEIDRSPTGGILNTKIRPMTPHPGRNAQIKGRRRGNAIGCRGNPDRLRGNQLRNRARSHDNGTVIPWFAQLESRCRRTDPQGSPENPGHLYGLFDRLAHDHPYIKSRFFDSTTSLD
jgi:hypothetical protein